MTPDPKVAEDLVEAGRRAMLRSVLDDTAARTAIHDAADWLLTHARTLRGPDAKLPRHVSRVRA